MAQTNHKLFFFRVKGWGIEGAWIKDPLMIFNAWPAGCAKNLTWERSSDFGLHVCIASKYIVHIV